MIRPWVLSRLEGVKNRPRVLLRDPFRMLARADPAIDAFAREHGFSAIPAETNLQFRELYARVKADPDVRKILVIDRTPLRRRARIALDSAPAPFYPDFLAETPTEARVDLDPASFSWRSPKIRTGPVKSTTRTTHRSLPSASKP